MSLIKPNHKAIAAYYATLQDLAAQNVSHEMGLRGAFQQLLTETAKLHDWTLIPEDSTKPPRGTVRPDATLRDKNTLFRGFWEAQRAPPLFHRQKPSWTVVSSCDTLLKAKRA